MLDVSRGHHNWSHEYWNDSEGIRELYAHEFDNLDEIDQLHKRYKLSSFIQGEIEIWISSVEIESMIKNFSQKKTPGPDDFKGKFCQTFKEGITPSRTKRNAKKQNGCLRRTYK